MSEPTRKSQLLLDFLSYHLGNAKDVAFLSRHHQVNYWNLGLAAVVAFLILDQALYAFKRWKYQYAGPAFTVPFLGGIVEMGASRLCLQHSQLFERIRVALRCVLSCGEVERQWMSWIIMFARRYSELYPLMGA